MENDHTEPILHVDDDLFYFETDHLALKGNKDYCEVLKTIVILTAQREKALKDLGKVIQAKKAALEDPIAFLEKIKNNEDLGLPPMMEIPPLPKIDFSKYSTKVPEEDINSIYAKKSKETIEDIKYVKNSNDNNKWTTEEQKKLEDLLLVYPPEPIERRRYEKIAKALGNRTVQQVCSRVQKYFLKLYKAGLPVPGRIPKSGEKYKKSLLHKHQRHNHYLWRPSTFFPELNVPVLMDDTENVPGPSNAHSPASSSSSNNYLMPTNYLENEVNPKPVTKNPVELQLELLNRVKREKLVEREREPYTHTGFRCDYCDEEPMVGTRWHCTVCTNSIDFCTDCILSQLLSENRHPLSHRLVKFHGPASASYSDSESNSGSLDYMENETSDFSDLESDQIEEQSEESLHQLHQEVNIKEESESE